MKRNEQLLYAIGEIDGDLIPDPGEARRRSAGRWIPAMSAAVLAAAALFAAVILPKMTAGNTPPVVSPGDTSSGMTDGGPEDSLALLPAAYRDGSMGFEGMMVNDLSELDNNNPWSAEMELGTLPVFRNLTYHPDHREYGDAPVYYPAETMTARAEEIAGRLGLTVEKTAYYHAGGGGEGDETGDDIYRIVAALSDGETSVQVLGDGAVTVSFEPGRELPAEYAFGYREASAERAESVVLYLLDAFADLLPPMTSPAVSVPADRNIYGEIFRRFLAYDNAANGAGSDEAAGIVGRYLAYAEAAGDAERILAYNFGQVSFGGDEDGRLHYIRWSEADAMEPVGNYPLLTESEARERLLGGEYYTSVPSEFYEGPVRAEDVSRVELVYRTYRMNEFFLPWYRYLVKLDRLPGSAADMGMEHYGAFYVPAVRPEFLS